MGIISKIKGWINMLFRNKVEEEFNIESITSSELDNTVSKCMRIYKGYPEWIDEENHIKTINFAKAICSETARLAMMGIKIVIDGSTRAEWLQKEIDKVFFNLRNWVEYGCAYGTVILKPTGEGIELIPPDHLTITDEDNGKVTGAVFINRKTKNNKFYIRLEYHRFIKDLYVITNRCFIADSESDRGRPIDIKRTPWANLEEEQYIQNMESPLFGVLRMPHANNVDINSPVGLPIFIDAIEELKDLDIAYSRNAKEILDSKRTVLLDSDKLLPTGGKISNTERFYGHAREEMGLPDYIKNVYGNGQDDFYQEINPQLNTDARLSGINALLSQIGYKVGYSNGYYVFNESTGIQTATEVEANQQRTIQFIKDIRDQIESCMDGLIYALNVFADIYNLAPVGRYEVLYDFGDITYNQDEDRQRWWGYVMANKIPAWMYFTKFEGMSEEEAKAIEKEMQPKQPKLFGDEE